MNALTEASYLVRKIAEPAPAGDSVKAAILRAYRRLGSWTHSRVRSVWYGDHRISISGDELNQLRAVARQDMDFTRDADLAEIRGWIATTEARLQRIDAEFFGEIAEGFRQAAYPQGTPSNGSDSTPDEDPEN